MISLKEECLEWLKDPQPLGRSAFHRLVANCRKYLSIEEIRAINPQMETIIGGGGDARGGGGSFAPGAERPRPHTPPANLRETELSKSSDFENQLLRLITATHQFLRR